MFDTPIANRLHIAIFGKRNAGKSSLINALTNQEISLVSDTAGTTTDPVYKAMELLPIGPVVFIDTAGLDDVGELGELRVKKTKAVMEKTDLALLVLTGDEDTKLEEEYLLELKQKSIPVVGVVNKIDEKDADVKKLEERFKISFVKVSAKDRINIDELKNAIFENAPMDFERSTIVGDVVKPKDCILLVAPQDIQAPKGRLILPQVQVIRDLLDNDAVVTIIKDSELKEALNNLSKIDLVITDSQVFKYVNETIPKDMPLTSFSILMARYKGDLKTFIEGAKAIDNLKEGDEVLIAESCTHHPLRGDIGREKLPKWLEERVKGKINIKVKAGADFEENLSKYKLIIHCGACMFNRKQMMSRIIKAKENNVPITNYGIAIAYMNGILDRVVEIFK
ncbi:[FeFe] hydrogenase H-cluster maturation GTPase HydF [Caloramator sp. E03]|uniref:[FeFe] hydrogenase H-cluster maturation GTPase HydF n=1 Tax=Caloramator sp. E03 TaxID=2576307 RepID=UPI001110CC6D|nr:[FeFe] hydrogenase H-cluster maturation GTPase HydF [Caloramator sp. E03]QCX33361.1 [FeFe] hydrogenase H-cluster maturation GTPase HydF [Caloramator sp. E03]